MRAHLVGVAVTGMSHYGHSGKARLEGLAVRRGQWRGFHALPDLAPVTTGSHGGIDCCRPVRLCAPRNRLYNRHHRRQSSSDLLVLGLDGIFLAKNTLKFLIWLLSCQLLYPSFQGVNLCLCPLSNSSLCFAIIGALLCKLFGCQAGYTSGRVWGLALFGRGVCWRGRIGRRLPC